ncbi:GntR family transcriptional regulator [soil metagenome]
MHDTDLPSFQPLERPPIRLADFVYEQLLDAIAAGSVPPGVRLVQGALAEQMNVSRTPVREALLRLEREKILVGVDRGGFVVRTISSDDAHQIYQVRQAIEGYGARLVAEGDDPVTAAKTLLPLVEATEDWVPADGLKDAFRRNDALHRGVVEATANPVLVEAFDLVWARAQSFLMYAAIVSIDVAVEEPGTGHRDILEAISAADGAKAQEMMIVHIAHGLEAQIEALEQQQSR